MIFSPNKFVLASMFLTLAAQTSAHAIPNPALGVKGTPKRSDTQRPSTAKPCGKIDIATNLDTSTAIPAAADGTVTLQVQNFNPGADGSTSVSVEVDETGTGNKFVPATVTKNGNPNPTKVETDQVVFSLPAGTKCAGGKAKNLCLVSVKTTHGFGACTVVSQGGKASANPTVNPAVAQLAAKQLDKKHINATCAADSECRQGCCGFSTGKCAGPRAAQIDSTGGCGHGNASPNCNVASLLGSKNCILGGKTGNLQNPAIQAAAAFSAQLHNLTFAPTVKSGAKASRAAAKSPSIAQLAAKQQKKKVVFDTCAADHECQQGCCGFSTGKCAGPDVAQTNGSGGCGHGNASPNCNVATLLGFKNCVAGVKNFNLHHPVIQAAAAFTAKLDNLPFTPKVVKPKGKKGTKKNRDMGTFLPFLVFVF
ncbi:hypothetical protein B0H19DRAFT_646931 [Mycena capillaripes]|nr:hypothetical protein B0H19DRAFT_646931 [Mycena capillaripes]